MRAVERTAAIMASAGILAASLAFAYQQAAPHLSEQDCILQGTRSSGDSAILAVRACRERFQTDEAEQVELLSFLRASLEGRARFSSGTLSARIYNGDANYTITRLRIGVTDPETIGDDEPVIHYYEVAVNIPPMSVDTTSFSVFEEYDEAVWHITRAWGHNTEK